LPDLPGMLTPLGLQGCRLFDREPLRSLMQAEVDALGRIASGLDLSILVPFVTDVLELRRWREVILERLPAPMPVGAMAETPAAVLALPDLLEEGGFAGIGCNDLLQCLFAADRDLPAVAGLVDPYAPAVFRFLSLAADAASGMLDRVQICGLLPQLPGVLPVLIGLGFRAFSVEPLLIPRLARKLGGVDIAQTQSLARAVCAAGEPRTVRRLLGLSGGLSWGVESFDPGRGLM
jgi:phosphoenolpyruvate-protein kinase (PTS system EI component)